jgi:hypothetical protein
MPKQPRTIRVPAYNNRFLNRPTSSRDSNGTSGHTQRALSGALLCSWAERGTQAALVFIEMLRHEKRGHLSECVKSPIIGLSCTIALFKFLTMTRRGKNRCSMLKVCPHMAVLGAKLNTPGQVRDSIFDSSGMEGCRACRLLRP